MELLRERPLRFEEAMEGVAVPELEADAWRLDDDEADRVKSGRSEDAMR